MIEQRDMTLDGIKGIATAIVLLHHFAISFYQSILTGETQLINTKSRWELFIHRIPLEIIVQGGFAVLIFFTISAYLLKRKINKNANSLLNYKVIIGGRAIRLIPLAAIAIMLGYMLMKLGFTYNVRVAEYSKSGSLGLLFPNGHVSFKVIISDIFTRLLFGPPPRYYNILWIIPYEIMGAWFVCAFSIFSQLANHKKILYALFGTAFIMTNSYYIAFLFGMMLADYEGKFKLNNLQSISLIMISFIFGSTAIESFGIIHYSKFAIIFRSIAALTFIIVILNNKSMQKIIHNNILTYLGRNSYYYYLIHMVTLITLPCFVFLKMIPFMRYHQAVAVTFLTYITLIPIMAMGLKQVDKTIIRTLLKPIQQH